MTVTGTLGILLKARQEGFIKEIRPLLMEMKRKGFYISAAIEPDGFRSGRRGMTRLSGIDFSVKYMKIKSGERYYEKGFKIY